MAKSAEVIAHISRRLYMALLKVQTQKNKDFDEACDWAAALIESKEQSYRRDVEIEADRLLRSKYLTDLNKARGTIESKAYGAGYQKGHDDGYNVGYWKAMEIEHFIVPCYWCNKPLQISSEDSDWGRTRQVLEKTFWNRAHFGTCLQRGQERLAKISAQKRAAQESYAQ